MESNIAVKLRPMDSGQLGRLLHHLQNNHAKDRYNHGKLIQRCRPFLTYPEQVTIAIEFDVGHVTVRFDYYPEATMEDESMYDYVMRWLDEPTPPEYLSS